VGKSQLDVAWHETGEHLVIENTPQAIRVLIRRLAKEGVQRIVLEATGRYERALLLAAVEAGLPIVVVNPLMVRRYAGAIGRLAKTDKLDAGLIAEFAAIIKPDVRMATNAKTLQIKDLLLRRRQLMGMRTMELNRQQQYAASQASSCKR